MHRISPAERDRAQRRVRSVTMATAAGAAVLAVGGGVLASATFAGKPASASASPATQATADPSATQDPTTLQPPAQPPGPAPGGGFGGPPVTSGGS
jgi:hypothetical protein